MKTAKETAPLIIFTAIILYLALAFWYNTFIPSEMGKVMKSMAIIGWLCFCASYIGIKETED